MWFSQPDQLVYDESSGRNDPGSGFISDKLSAETMAQGMRVTGAEPWISTLEAQDLVGTSGVLCATCLVMTW